MGRVEIPEPLATELKQCAELVNRELAKLAEQCGWPAELRESTFYLPSAGGKRLRPFLVIKSAELFGKKAAEVLPAALAIEMVHNFTLVHDDIMDRDEFRRDKPTVHVVYGEPMAILAGDTLLIEAYRILVDGLKALGYTSSTIVEAVTILTEACLKVSEGQTIDMNASKYVKTIEDYVDLVEKKTSSLFVAATKLGAVLSRAPDSDVDALAAFARDMGVAFQIVDDILGLVGSPKETGKPVGSDLREGKRTLLVLRALELADGEGRRAIERALGNRSATEDEIKAATEAIVATGALDFARGMAERYMKSAVSRLSHFPESKARAALEQLCEFIVSRRR